jgi:hypothetical protein
MKFKTLAEGLPPKDRMVEVLVRVEYRGRTWEYVRNAYWSRGRWRVVGTLNRNGDVVGWRPIKG